MPTLRSAAALLAAATNISSLAPIAALIGCPGAPAPLDAAGRTTLGIPDDCVAASVARGPDTLRALLVDVGGTRPMREVLIQLARYLVTHGADREPCLLDVQYRRIPPYADALASKLGPTFKGRRAYVHANFPRERYPEDLPGLQSLYEAITATQYEAVFVDIWPPPHFNDLTIDRSVRHYLTRAGAVVYSAYFDDERAIGGQIAARWGDEARYAFPRSDEDEITALFPAVPAHGAEEVFARDPEREPMGRMRGPYGLDEAARRRVYTTTRHFASENPYQSDWIPPLTDYERDQLQQYERQKRVEAENALRRESEPLYRVYRGKPPPLLSDEHLKYNRKRRDADALRWPGDRLAAPGFERTDAHRVITHGASKLGSSAPSIRAKPRRCCFTPTRLSLRS